ncbi:MAG: glycosyltransferase [Pseudomonadota bacterium]|nr:glycosyltransferase [Pseudomonadota bacterium]
MSLPPSTNQIQRSVPAIAGGVFLASLAGLVLLSNTISPSVGWYVAILAGSSALVSVLLWRGGEFSARAVLTVAVLGHVIALFGQTIFEDDYYRFIWDGWRVLVAGTPYGVPPESLIDDPSVPASMQSVLEWVNYPEYPTIYGPALQIIFAATSFFAGSDELGLRVLFAGSALAVCALLLKRHSPAEVALFAWNPVVVAETTLHLHPDILMSLFLLAGLIAGRRHTVLAGVFIAIAAGVKIVALAAWPILLRLRPVGLVSALGALALLYSVFAVQGLGVGLDSTGTFATQWFFNPQAFELLFYLFGPDWGRLAALLIAGCLVLWFHARAQDFDSVPLAAIFGAILFFAPAVNAWYLLWLLPFALDRREWWPYAASAALPLSYLTGLNLEIFEMDEFAVHPIALRAEWLVIGGAILADLLRKRLSSDEVRAERTPIASPRVSVVMPALNEERSVGQAVKGILYANPRGLCEVIVADNGSDDGTARAARAAGAVVISEVQRGYGAACLAAIAAVDQRSNIILFMDADLSDVPEEAASLLEPIISGHADMVIGSRNSGRVEPGAMSVPQRFGNWLAPALVRLIWGARFTDLGPFRAIRADALERLHMADRDFGWTVEMQVRAAKIGLRALERPVSYRRRVGVSKISGTIAGVFAAGWKILFVIGREAFGDFDQAQQTGAAQAHSTVRLSGPVPANDDR